LGEKEVQEARQQKVFPKEVDDAVVTEYVNRLASNIARNSDLRVPLKVFLVQVGYARTVKRCSTRTASPNRSQTPWPCPADSSSVLLV